MAPFRIWEKYRRTSYRNRQAKIEQLKTDAENGDEDAVRELERLREIRRRASEKQNAKYRGLGMPPLIILQGKRQGSRRGYRSAGMQNALRKWQKKGVLIFVERAKLVKQAFA